MEIAWAIAAGIGLSALIGFRAFIPVAVFILMARLGWTGLLGDFKLQETPLDFLQSDAAIAVLAVLVVLEIVFTRVSGLSKVERMLRLPLATATGALVFSAVLSGPVESPIYFVGVPAGALMVLTGIYVHGGLVMVGEGRDPGPALDFGVLILSVLIMLVPPAGYVMGIIILYLALRVRRLKKIKYKGLRVLA
ncbi:MAG: DUF4126 domain-containing protein [Thermoleophilia bacterium]|jgi:hypothetical protein